MAGHLGVTLGVAGASVAGASLLAAATRRWARRVAAAPGAGARPDVTAGAAHRLRRAQVALAATGLAGVLGAAAAVAGTGRATPLVIPAIALLLGSRVAISAGTAPALAGLRGSSRRPAHPWRRRALGAGALAVYGAALATGEALAPRHGAAHAAVLVATYLVALTVINGLGAPLLVRAAGGRPLDPRTRERVMALNASLGGGIRDVLAYPGRSQRSANAVQVGLLPGLRYVLVSDYLLDHMTADEVDAVVGHELGHAREHHVALKVLATAACWAGLLAIVGTLAQGPGAVAVPAAYLVALLVVQGLLGLHLERRADAAAARDIGAAPLAAALGRLADLNDTPVRTGRGWALLTQHPGIAARIAALGSSPGPA